jgi:hypothetical protein
MKELKIIETFGKGFWRNAAAAGSMVALSLPQKACAAAMMGSGLVGSPSSEWWLEQPAQHSNMWALFGLMFGSYFMMKYALYTAMLLQSFNSVQAILVDNIEFDNDETIYDNVTEEGGKFTSNFRWKKDESGRLNFPEELKKFSKRASHKIETRRGEELDLIFTTGDPGEFNSEIKIRK